MSIRNWKILATFSATLLLVSACGDGSEGQNGQASAQAQTPPAAQVGFVSLQPESIDLVAEMPGRTVAYRKADVRPQVDGIINERNFREGGFVEAGQQLYLIDQDRYLANLAAAQAELARQQANLSLATKTRARYEKLLKSSAASEQRYDDAVAAEAQGRAAVAAARANVDRARIDLDYTKVTAPISGQIGASSYTEGALVTASQSSALATITQLDPIYVDVTQAGGKLLRIKDAIASGRITGLDDHEIDVRLILDASGQEYAHTGKLQFSEVTVNETTGTVRLRAVFPNPDKVLLPGMFVRGFVEQGRVESGFLVPHRAVMRRPDGSAYAYVIGEGDKVATADLQIEQSLGANWVVTAGLKAGDRLIVDGLQRIAPGAPVTPLDVGVATKTPNPTAG
ncbi:efflux RND transporter periplasmic adaptor subunit [Sneathiella chinensis]|uniref:Secretion protein HlyD n=1 Tax=Sneathiella chinensis TaxID=349750 RepID=A0ABQ5U101_9PROT|nr:efflux RND transporter periplasmic adaptor subunit [Sneathiella chinensis]GLQ05106.1 secretion protein HlyD [Sneathiella chinensis]